MENNQEQRVQFRVPASELVLALRGLKPARPRKRDAGQVLARLSAALDRCELAVAGVAVRFDARVAALGAALVPWTLLQKVKDLVETYGPREVTITVRDGTIEVEKTSLTSDRIEIVALEGDRPDLPIGASLPTVLALGRAHTIRDLHEWGILERYKKAEKDAERRLAEATALLEALRIRREDLQDLLDASIEANSPKQSSR